MDIVHTPVLLQECMDWLSPIGEPYEASAFMVDSTLGEGGHSAAFLSRFPALSIVGIDADAAVQKRAAERLAPFGERMQFYRGWFRTFYADYPASLPKPNIILFDLGISVFHYERSGRGFSFRYDEPLDMRLEPDPKNKTAAELVNGLREDELADLIYRYGEEKFSRKIARAVCTAARKAPITSSKALADIVYDAVPAAYRYAKLHPATRTFQALRIAVNSELLHLPEVLHNAFSALTDGGKLGVITFHSLEDRIVKNYFRNLGKKCVCPPEQAVCRCGGCPCAEILTKKPVVPADAEVLRNAPSRSAKFRAVRKLRGATESHLYGVKGY